MNMNMNMKVMWSSPMCEQKKQKDRAVLQKPKLIVYIGRSQKVFEPDPNPKK